MPEHADKELIEKCKNGNVEAFEMFVEKYQQYIYSVAYRFLYNRDEAEDMTQECFIRIWKNFFRYNFRSKITTWMYKIITNLCLDFLKKKKRRQNVIVYETEDLTEIPAASCDDMENEFLSKELVSVTEKIINMLAPKQRAVFILRDIEDLNINQVSEILGISTGSVKSNLYLARLSIRKELQEKFNWST